MDMFVEGEEKSKVDESDEEEEDSTVAHSLQVESLMEEAQMAGNDSRRRLENESTPFLPLVPLRKNPAL